MSGITGLFHREGAPVQASDLNRMVKALVHRGPDRQGALCDGPVGLGHAMLWTTPESKHEILPRVCHQSHLAITADARVDNREELIEALGIDTPPAELSDSEIILAAYRKWGRHAPEKIMGDFVFAIWDATARELFCARDPMGVKNLYYFASSGIFAFGSEIKALLCLPEIPARLNELRVLDFFANFFDDRAITFYQDIYRLPAASRMTVSPSGVQIERYWELDPSRELKLSSDQEYTEAFRECFTKAVRARMRSAYPIGATVSGGLDSSSIACLARKNLDPSQSLHTFSLIFPSFEERILRHIDERNYMNDALQMNGFEPHWVRADQLSPLGRVCEMQQHLDEAFFMGNMYLHWEMFNTARRNGVRVFLDGFDGDTTISYGFDYLADLVRQFKWRTLYREGKLLSANLGITPKQFVRNYCIKPFCPSWVYKGWRRLHGRRTSLLDRTLLAENFKRKQGFDTRAGHLVNTRRSLWRNAREKHWEMINFPLYAHALEGADKASAAFQVEARYPFFDRRLIELCLALPGRQKLSQGWPRMILRRAMEGVLPESIRWRPGKANLSPNFYTRLLNEDRALVESVILQDPSTIEPYVDLPLLRQAYRSCIDNPLTRQDDSMGIFSAVNLAVWLKTAGVRP